MACEISETSKQPKQHDSSLFPDCWQDDTRMGVLLAEFRPKAVNPVAYESKMKFWKDAISKYCHGTGCSIISIAVLKEFFRRKETTPHCLHTVLENMIATGEIVNKEQAFKQQTDGLLGWGQWAMGNLLGTSFKWGYEKVRQSISGSKSENEERRDFILKDVAKCHGEIIQQVVRCHGLFNQITNLDDIVGLVKSSSNLSEEGIQAAMALLEQNQRIVRKNISCEGSHSNVLIKFAEPNSTVEPITDIERSIYEVKQRETILINEISKIENNIHDTMVEVRACIQDGRKHLAKTYLKKKHYLENNLQRKINVLENLQLLLSKIHDTQSDKHVVEAYKLGSMALKQTYKNAGITLEMVDEAILDMKEVLEQHDEIVNALGTVPMNDVDDLDLEQELSDLIDIKLAESNISGDNIISGPAINIPQQPTLSTIVEDDFDKEIENRLAALRVNTTESPSRVNEKLKINI